MEIDADLHLHGYFSGGVSDKMTVPVMAKQSAIKGLDLVGTGDILNPKWRDHVQKHANQTAPGIYATNDCNFLLSAEVESTSRVHHIILFPSFEAVNAVYNDLQNHSKDIDREGRPRLQINGERIAAIAKDNNCLIGPAHAFTPYTAIYGHHDSLEDCYGSMVSELDFLELGLSADTDLADQISSHNSIPFLSNSDAHSPWPHRMGREFNRFRMEEMSFPEIEKTLQRKGKRTITLNVGFDPREGKYHCSACQNCGQKYSLQQAQDNDWTCLECGKSIKKGVKDRISELADGGSSPKWRPEYTHLVPLAEIIREIVGHASVTTKGVQRVYDNFLSRFDSEIQILIDTPIDRLKEINSQVADAVEKFRDDRTIMIPGGGGEYGELIIPRDEEERQRIIDKRQDELECRYANTQQSLDNFSS
jgi:uncharacterized protein (TIGR00375 family)